MPPKDVRKLFKKQQQARQANDKKITHPFAKYDEQSRLICIVCNAPVKSVWQAHLGSALHVENIQKLKALKQQQNLKRKAPEVPVIQTEKRTRLDQDIEVDQDSSTDEQDEEMGLPADFFDNNKEEIEEVEQEAQPVETKGGLPTGFFDDPEEEARVQGTLAPEDQAKLELEKDIDMFHNEMIEVTQESNQVQEQDDETFWLERHDDMNREQALFDSRVEKLKHLRQAGVHADKPTSEEGETDEITVELKTSVRQLLKNKPIKQQTSVFDDDESSEEEEEGDWRAQQL